MHPDTPRADDPAVRRLLGALNECLDRIHPAIEGQLFTAQVREYVCQEILETVRRTWPADAPWLPFVLVDRYPVGGTLQIHVSWQRPWWYRRGYQNPDW